MKRKIASLLIIFFGVGVSFFILKSNNSSSFSSPETPKPFFESKQTLTFKTKPLNPPSFKETNPDKKEKLTQDSNFTENLAKTYARKIIEQNKEMKTINEISKINFPSFEINDLLDFNENWEQFLNASTFEYKDIKISNDNSKENQIAYLETVDMALKKNFGWLKKDIGMALEEYIKNNDAQTLKNIIKSIPGLINDLLKISVPPSFSFSHLQMLNLWQKKQIIYQTILNSKTDPLKAYLALQKLPDLIQENVSLNSILVQRYNELVKNQ